MMRHVSRLAQSWVTEKGSLEWGVVLWGRWAERWGRMGPS